MKALVKRSEFLLIRGEKIVMLSFMTLVMNLGIDLAIVLMSDKKRILRCRVMFSFTSLSIGLIMMPDKRESYVLFYKVRLRKS